MLQSFRNKILLLTIGLVCTVQIVTFVSVLSASKDTVDKQIRHKLEGGSKVIQRIMYQRSQQLLGSVRVLTSDYGFKKAVALQDTKTIRSVLDNHGARIDADIAVLISLDGAVIASTGAGISSQEIFPFPELVAQASNNGYALATTTLHKRPYQIVMVPIDAPERLAWAFMGFELNEQLAATLKSLTGLEVTFSAHNDDAPSFTASTLPAKQVEVLSGLMGRRSYRDDTPTLANIGGQEFLTLSRSLSTAGGITAILQRSLDKALAPYRSLWGQMILFACLVLVAAFCVAVTISRSMTRPMQTLMEALHRIESGDYSQPVALTHKDEWGRLAGMFNLMQQGIAKREEAQLSYQAYHDTLTGLANRALAYDRLHVAIQRARRHDLEVAVLLLDLDRFKNINDSMGHHIGDTLLTCIATQLSQRLRSSDTLARLGGDEFLIILNDSGIKQAVKTARELAGLVTSGHKINDLNLSVGVSIGVASYPKHGEEVETLLRRADLAMYEAKNGNGEIRIYQSGQDESYARKLEIINGLVEAVEHDHFNIHYQPKMAIESHQVSDVEALIRWTHPKHGVLSPDEFIPIAEQSGNISRITDWMTRKVIQQCQIWDERGIRLNVAINLSTLDLLHDKLIDNIQHYLLHYGVDPSCLTLEITEHTIMQNFCDSLRLLQKIKTLGIRLSIDDFGSGYSSLAQLRSLPVDELKIDKSFLADLAQDKDAAVIVRSIVDLGHNMGLKVVAEGVENSDVWSFLIKHNCDVAQGYYILRPVPAPDLLDWLHRCNATAPAATPCAPLAIEAQAG